MKINNYKKTFLISLGAAFEYYDFIVYALMAHYLIHIFFKGSGLESLIHYLHTFALGYIVRPLGGILFGLISDKYGRKSSFLIIIILMSIATLTMGLLPMNSSSSLYLLILARVVQGIAFGGEVSNAITFVQESNNRDSTHGGILTSAITFGSIMALFTIYLLTSFLSEKQIISWGWRVPFLFGGTMVLCCYWVRKDLVETSEYMKTMSEKKNIPGLLKELFTKQKLRLAIGLTLSTFVLSLLVVSIFLPTYFPRFFGYEAKRVSLALTISLIVSMFISPFVGAVLNKVNKIKFITYVILLLIPCLWLMFRFLSPALFNITIFMIIYEIFLSILYIAHLSFLVDLFDVKIRTTAVGFCYNIGYAIASFLPAFITYLIQVKFSIIFEEDKHMLLWILIGISVAAFVILKLLCKNYDK